MWDKILGQIDHKVTPQKAIMRWHGDQDSVVLISSGINLVYRFLRDKKPYYLRLTHTDLKPLEELQAALAFQQHLQSYSVPVCLLVSSDNGNFIEAIQQDKHLFLAHVVAEVPGSAMHFDYETALYQYWGESLGRFHLASQSYKTDHHEYSHWENDITELNGYAKAESTVIRNELAEVLSHLKSHPQITSNYGLIHGDHRKGNVLSDGRQIHFIDFDLPRYCWFMDDISRPFFSSIMKNHQNWQDKLVPYIKGYRSVLELTDADLQTFPWFMRYRALNMYLWTKNNWHSDIAPGGANTQQWLKLMKKMIINRDWVLQVKCIIGVSNSKPE